MAGKPAVFEDRYIPEPMSGCWLWLGCDHGSGYGIFGSEGKSKYAHRVSFEIFNGEIPPGMFVLHRCDVRACVNPNHLFLGTNLDNAKDMVGKDRQAKCERFRRAKLTDDQIRSIRRDKRTQKEIASEYGISQPMVSEIKLRKSWRHVND